MENRNKEQHEYSVDYKMLLENEKNAHLKTKIKLNARQNELHTITQSQSYKLAKKIAIIKHYSTVVANHTKELSPKRIKQRNQNLKHVKSVYTSQKFNKDFLKLPSSDTAVVLHLFYPDLLDYFKSRIKHLSGFSYDLFISLPDNKQDEVPAIKAAFPESRIIITPNSGRDVLPFVEVTRKLNTLGYTKVLKLHSKKSPHREDGDLWRDTIVNNLLPSNKQSLQAIIDRLDDTKTALIGPAEEYVSFIVNYYSTAHHTKKLIKKNYDEKKSREIETVADEFGFFAGTMFWARIDSLMPVINSVHFTDFEPELGQEDSTMAHALERLFCVIPELNGLNIYGNSSHGLYRLDYHTANIPGWSDFAVKA